MDTLCPETLDWAAQAFYNFATSRRNHLMFSNRESVVLGSPAPTMTDREIASISLDLPWPNFSIVIDPIFLSVFHVNCVHQRLMTYLGDEPERSRNSSRVRWSLTWGYIKVKRRRLPGGISLESASVSTICLARTMFVVTRFCGEFPHGQSFRVQRGRTVGRGFSYQ